MWVVGCKFIKFLKICKFVVNGEVLFDVIGLKLVESGYVIFVLMVLFLILFVIVFGINVFNELLKVKFVVIFVVILRKWWWDLLLREE